MPRPDPTMQAAAAENEALRRRELERILGIEYLDRAGHAPRDDEAAAEPYQRMANAERALWGLALSGGGIRSATFSLGVVHALAQLGWLGGFHYLSTVSGGGYTGAYLQALIDRHGLPGTLAQLAPRNAGEHARNAGGASEAVQQLRKFSNFLAPNNGALSADRVSVVATYLSNMLLTQVQLLALLVLVCFLPMLAYRVAVALAGHPLWTWLLALSAAALAMALRHQARNEPARERDQHRCAGDERRTHDAPPRARISPLALAAPPVLMATALVLLSLLVWRVPDMERCTSLTGYGHLGALLQAQCGWLAPAGVAATYLIGETMWLHWWWRSAIHTEGDNFGRRVLRHVVFGGLAAVGIGAVAYAMRGIELGASHLWFVLALGPLLLFGAFYLVSLAHVGLAFMPGDQVVREQWARFMGRCALAVGVGVSLPITLIVLLPQWLLFAPPAFDDVPHLLLPLASGATSLLGVFAAYRDDTRARRRSARWHARARGALIAVAPWAFIFFIVVLAAMLAGVLLSLVAKFAGTGVEGVGLAQAAATLESLGAWFAAVPLWTLLAPVAGVAFVWFVFARFIDENEFSMNGFYRNRLVRCYLAPSNRRRHGDADSDLDPTDDLPLDRVAAARGTRDMDDEDSGAPARRPLYPLICASVNLTAGAGLDWQDRKAASFVFSPLFCGHQRVPLRSGDVAIGDEPQANFSRLAEKLTLGTAMAVFGAAISPNMGYHSSPAVAFLLTLFNARLGWWVENHNVTRGESGFVGRNLLSEMLSQTTADGRYAHVSDGGHFENLGLYELVRRRCRFILSIDASADPDRDFEGLGNAIQLCRTDFDAHIEIDTGLMRPDAKSGLSQRCAALGKIRYADGSAGVLLYLKPSLLGTEPPDIAHYAAGHAEFPHEPTSDQFFDERQFEAYRYLGYLACLRVLDAGIGANERVPRLRLEDHALKETALLQLTYRLFEPSNAVSLHFSRHGDALASLLRRLRERPALDFLDQQFNHGWWRAARLAPAADHVPAGNNVHQSLPEGEAFRECWYFVQELMQFMEGVYVDLELDRNAQHPDNRGWINLFRSWAWMPLFRLAWALTAQNRGSRFVRFCESVLELPGLGRCVDAEPHACECGAHLQACAARLHAQGKVNFVERALLASPLLVDAHDSHHPEVWVLQLCWHDVLASTVGDIRGLEPVSMGVAMTVRDDAGHETLVLMRIQDHMRRLGLAARFVELIARQRPALREARIAAGAYAAPVGRQSVERAAQHTRKLQQLLDEARQRLRDDHTLTG